MNVFTPVRYCELRDMTGVRHCDCVSANGLSFLWRDPIWLGSRCDYVSRTLVPLLWQLQSECIEVDTITGELPFIAMVDNCISFWDRFGIECRKHKWRVYGQSLCGELVK